MYKILVLVVLVGLVASEAPLKRNFSRRLAQRQELAPTPAPEYGAPEATTKSQGYQYPPPEKPFEDGESSGDSQTDSGYLPPEETTTGANQEDGYQYPTPEKPFEDGQEAETPSTESEGQVKNFRVQGLRTARFEKLSQSQEPILTIVPSVELVNIF